MNNPSATRENWHWAQCDQCLFFDLWPQKWLGVPCPKCSRGTMKTNGMAFRVPVGVTVPSFWTATRADVLKLWEAIGKIE